VHGSPNDGSQPYQPSLLLQHWIPPPQPDTHVLGTVGSPLEAHQSVWQQSASDVQLPPAMSHAAGTHEDPMLGSLQPVYAVALPEQHALAVVVSVSGPMQVQTPPLHLPEAHASLPVHAAPFGSVAWHVPALQKPDWQSPSPVHGSPFGFVPQVPSTQAWEVHASAPVHGVPSACVAVQVPAAQNADWQSPSPAHAFPSGCLPHVPSTHAALRHSAALEQGWPSGRPHLPW
jgi:hypothetical protein